MATCFFSETNYLFQTPFWWQFRILLNLNKIKISIIPLQSLIVIYFW
jgi:hypothetical protein